jgi:hypothetical protein
MRGEIGRPFFNSGLETVLHSRGSCCLECCLYIVYTRGSVSRAQSLPSRLINGGYQSLRRESLPVKDSGGADHHSRPDDGKADGEDGQEVGVVPGGLGRNGTRTLLTILAVPRRRHPLMAPLAVGNLHFWTIVRPGVLLQRGLGEGVGHCAVVMRNEETCPLR